MMKYLILLSACALLWTACGPSAPQNDDPAYHTPATQAFTDSIADNPENANYYFQRAEALSDMDRDSLALVDVYAAQKLDPKDPKYNFTIGYLELKRNKPEEAIRALLRHLQQVPGNVNTRLLLSRAYMAGNNIAAAKEQVDKILVAAPRHPEALMTRARIKTMEKDTAAAIAIVSDLLAQDPGNVDASWQLADWYKASGDPKAVTQYEHTFLMDTTDAGPLFDIGDYYELRNQPQEAKMAYRNCIRQDMDYTDAYIRIGHILLQQDSVEKALRHFNLAINTLPNSAIAYAGKGACFEQLHQKDSAAAAYRQALIFDRQSKAAAEGLKRVQH